MPPTPPEAGKGTIDLGKRLRWFRLRQGLRLDDVAERLRCTKGFLSKIECNRITPPIAMILRLAEALGVDPTAFFVGEGDETSSRVGLLTKATDRTRMDNRGPGLGYRYEALAARRPLKLMEPFIITVTPAEADFEKTFRHPGEEFIFLLEGKMDYRVGDQLFAMEAGDAFYFDATRPHAPMPKDGPATFLAIFCAPPRPMGRVTSKEKAAKPKPRAKKKTAKTK